jgi:hypothetical protein
MIGGIAVGVGIAEDGSDDVESREQRRTGIYNEDADALSCFGYDRCRFVLVDITVEDDIVGKESVDGICPFD